VAPFTDPDGVPNCDADEDDDADDGEDVGTLREPDPAVLPPLLVD
jgi:hypothetical protein